MIEVSLPAILRSRAVVARLVHVQEVVSSNLTSATNHKEKVMKEQLTKARITSTARNYLEEISSEINELRGRCHLVPEGQTMLLQEAVTKLRELNNIVAETDG